MFKKGLAALAVVVVSAALTDEARADFKYTNLKKADWQNYLDTFLPMGYRITHWDVKVVGGEPRYDLNLKKGKGPAFAIRTGLTSDQFETVTKQMKAKGYALKKHRAYTIKGVNTNAAYYEK